MSMFDDPKVGEWRYTPTVMDGPVVRFAWDDRFEINASRNGVSMSGPCPVMPNISYLKEMLDVAQQGHFAIGENGDHDKAKAWVFEQNRRLA